MLFNKSTGLKPSTKTAPMTVKSLIAWLETKPAAETYSYIDGSRCLLAQYLHDNGHPNARVSAIHYDLDAFSLATQSCKIPQDFHDIAIGNTTVHGRNDHTFGAALRRAKSYV